MTDNSKDRSDNAEPKTRNDDYVIRLAQEGVHRPAQRAYPLLNTQIPVPGLFGVGHRLRASMISESALVRCYQVTHTPEPEVQGHEY